MTKGIKQVVPIPPSQPPPGTIAIIVQMPPDKPGFAIDDATDGIALAGLVMALLSAVIAWQAYARSKEESRLTHVNGLFREMLAMEYDYHKNLQDDAETNRQAYLRLMSHKMWVLEELWLWLQDYKSEWRRPWFGAVRKARHHEAEGNWQSTIENHIRRREEWHFENFDRSSASYSAGFTEMVSAVRADKIAEAAESRAKGMAASDPS